MPLNTFSKTAIRYKLKEGSNGCVLYVWEPADLTKTRVRPFLFMAKYPAKNREAAMELLNQYLKTHEQSLTESRWHEPSMRLGA